MPPAGLLSAFVRPAEAGGILAPELKQDRLTVKLPCTRQLVMRTLAGDCAVEEACRFERPNGSTHLRFGEPKVRSVGQLTPVNRKGRHDPARGRPEPPQEHGQCERRVAITGRGKRRDQTIPHVMRQAVRSGAPCWCERTTKAAHPSPSRPG